MVYTWTAGTPLSLVSNTLAQVYLDPDVLVFRNPLPHLLDLDADVAVPEERCAVPRDKAPLPVGTSFSAYTSILWAEATPRAVSRDPSICGKL